MLLLKLLGLAIFGAILAMPVHVTIGSVLAAWKLRERAVLGISLAFSYAVVALLIFGTDGPLSEAETQRAVTAVERSKAELLADLHRSREECKALAISLAAETQEFRNKQFSKCMEGVRAETESTSGTLKVLDARLSDLKSTPK